MWPYRASRSAAGCLYMGNCGGPTFSQSARIGLSSISIYLVSYSLPAHLLMYIFIFFSLIYLLTLAPYTYFLTHLSARLLCTYLSSYHLIIYLLTYVLAYSLTHSLTLSLTTYLFIVVFIYVLAKSDRKWNLRRWSAASTPPPPRTRRRISCRTAGKGMKSLPPPSPTFLKFQEGRFRMTMHVILINGWLPS